jgi:hypothetical protein
MGRFFADISFTDDVCAMTSAVANRAAASPNKIIRFRQDIFDGRTTVRRGHFKAGPAR